MALPYYMPPSAPFATTPTNNSYLVPATSYEQVHQIQQQHNVNTMAFLQGVQYPPPILPPPAHGYGFNYPPIPSVFAPPMSNFMKQQQTQDSRAFTYTVPSMIYPIPPVPLQPLPYPVKPRKSIDRNYETELIQVARREAAFHALLTSDVQKQLKTKPSHNYAESLPSSSKEKSRHLHLEVTSSIDVSQTAYQTPILSNNNAVIHSESKVNSHHEGTQTKDPILAENILFGKDYKPGPGQQYINKIRSLVEGTPNFGKKSSPSRNERKMLPKPKPRYIEPYCALNQGVPCKKRIIADLLETDWPTFPKPVPFTIDHLMIGLNRSFMTTSTYATIPWESAEKAIQTLTKHFFSDYILSTQNLEGDNPLNPHIIEDIVNLVADKCHVEKDYVRNQISEICAEAARQYIILD